MSQHLRNSGCIILVVIFFGRLTVLVLVHMHYIEKSRPGFFKNLQDVKFVQISHQFAKM